MTLQVVGAGLGRTGTHSLKAALEQLLGGPCYHMIEVFGRPDDIPVWHAAINGDLPDWNAFLSDYRAAVDWPASAFWRELADANPDAVVLLSTRSDSDGVVEEREQHDLPRRRPAGDGRRRDLPRAEGHGARHVQEPLHPRLSRRDGGEEGLRSPQRRRARARSRPTA